MAANLTLRVPTGVPLTNQQVDDNFTALNTYGNTIVSGNLSQFGATTSLQLASIMTNETGSGNLVFNTSPTLITPNIGTPSYIVFNNATGLPVAAVVGGASTGKAIAMAMVFGG